jgi:16S rRNA G1207 methylase RsmC
LNKRCSFDQIKKRNIKDTNYTIKRNDLTKDKSLKAWSAADEYLLQSFYALEEKPKYLGIYNDRFGYLSSHLIDFNPITIMTHKSQEKAMVFNFKANFISLPNFANPIDPLKQSLDFALVKIPKSLDLFRLFLEQICHSSSDNITVICAFMTRHFSPKMLTIAGEYFENIEQSRALKKSRLLKLSKKKTAVKKELIKTLTYNDKIYKQYPGVFSGEHIDYATQFFLEHLEILENDQTILDLASGNGVIAGEILSQLPKAEIHLLDDAYLAIASGKLNIEGANIHHHYNNELTIFKDDFFDLIVSNPPFHFEFEINIQITLDLLRQCRRCLKKGGVLQIVGNKHLNYKSHLSHLFSNVEILEENKKYIIYRCIKGH